VRNLSGAFAVVLAALVRPISAVAMDSSAAIEAVRAPQTLPLDASLADPHWKVATRLAGFTEATTRTAGHSTTEAALLYDDTNLYIAFWCNQAAPITSIQHTDNVGFGTDDYVGVGVDPSGNADRTYYFEITPTGTRYQQASESARYQPVWKGASKIASGKWSAMLVIPLADMRLPGSAVQSWRVNFVRFVAQGSEKFTWGYSPQMDPGTAFPSLADARYWPTLRGVRIVAPVFHRVPGVAVFALGDVGQGRNQFVTPAGVQFTKNPRPAGLDLIYPVTRTMNFVGTLNPDFSNVDADQLTITPQVLPRNLTEYRPFFAQGASFINNSATALAVNEAPNLTFYSPSIGTFDRGMKLEGTFGNYQSLGLLEARGTNDTTGQTFDDIAFGYKHVLPSRTFGYWTNGVIANHGDVHDSTVELGVQARDLRTGWVGALFHEFESGTLIGDDSKALSTYGFIDHQGPTHEALLGFRDIGPLYNPIDGYTQISDIHGFTGSYNLFGAGGPHSALKDGNIFVFADRYLDNSGAVHKADAGVFANGDLKNNFSLALSSVQSELRSYNGNFQTGYPFYANPLQQPFDQTSVGLGYKLNSPTPTFAQYSWGPFENYYLQQLTSNATRPIGGRYTVSLEYDGTRQLFRVGPANGQWLRRISFGWSIDARTTLALGLRDISGTGGFAVPGVNFSGAFHRLYTNGDELYLSFGTPAANQTINRYLAKYLFRIGPSASM
jgi:hypothetical protein